MFDFDRTDYGVTAFMPFIPFMPFLSR